MEPFAFPSLKTFTKSWREPATPRKNGDDVFVSSIARLLSAVSRVFMSTVYPLELGIAEFTTPVMSKHTNAFASVEDACVVRVIIPEALSLETVAIVGLPGIGPFMSALQNDVAAGVVLAAVIVNPLGKTS